MNRYLIAGALALSFSAVQAQDNLVDYYAANGNTPRDVDPVVVEADPGDLTVFATRVDFDEAVPSAAQSCEDFEDTGMADDEFTAFDSPLDTTTDTALFPAGSIVPGLTIEAVNNSATPIDALAAVGPTAGFGNPSKVVLANFFEQPIDLVFDTSPGAVALDVVDLLGGGTVTVSVFDTSDVLIGSVAVTASATPGFVGVISPVAIGRVQIDSDADGSEGGDDICFAPLADLRVEKLGSPDPNVVAGTNLSYTVTVYNDGPSEAVNVVVDESLLPAELTSVTTTGCNEDPAGVPTCTIASIAAGANAVVNITGTVPASTAHNTVLTNTVSVSSDTPIPPDSGGNDEATEETTVIRQVNWRVQKIWDGGEVTVNLNCSDGHSDSGQTIGGWISFQHTGFPDDTSCLVTEEIPIGYYPTYQGDCNVDPITSGDPLYLCTITNATTVTRVQVIKTYSDGNTTPVDVTLTCDTGLDLQQTLNIEPGLPGVIFVLTDFVEGATSCEVSESGGPSGYTTEFIGDNDCDFQQMVSGQVYQCEVYNEALPGKFTVHKDWVIPTDGGDVVVEKARVKITCDRPLLKNGLPEEEFHKGDDGYSLRGELGDGESLTAMVDLTKGSANCWATERIRQSGVESQDDCESREIKAGGERECTFTNTVFFEGIPTLSQYGLAIMALLMLGMGAVAFRRFV